MVQKIKKELFSKYFECFYFVRLRIELGLCFRLIDNLTK